MARHASCILIAVRVLAHPDEKYSSSRWQLTLSAHSHSPDRTVGRISSDICMTLIMSV